MPVITISRGSYSHGKDVAEKVAEKLGYECVSREIILEASEYFNVPEFKLLKAIQDAPSFLDRITYGKEKYIAYVKAALLRHFMKDNVIYHGFAGHFFVADVPHVLKVRIIADFEERIRLVMEKDGVSREEAVDFLNKLDAERRKWGLRLYGIDTSDASLYDLVLHVKKLTVEDAADIVCYVVNMERFNTTEESKQMLQDLALEAEIKALLIDLRPDAEVSSKNGVVTVSIRLPVEIDETELVKKIEEKCSKVSGLKDLKVQVSPTTLFRQ